MEAGASSGGGGGGWRRAAALLLVAMLLSVVQPILMVAVAFAVSAVVLPPRRSRTVVPGLALAALFLGGGGEAAMLVDRGWALLLAGSFAGASLLWPGARFLPRALGALGVSGILGSAAISLSGDGWSGVDWLVESRLREGAGMALELIRTGEGGEALPAGFTTTIYRAMDVQHLVFPALLGLASVAALGVAWWVWLRLARGRSDGLGPLRDFRFNDQLVWLLVVGVACMVVPAAEAWSRAGTNVVVFMGTMYAVRGAGVLLFLTGGISFFGGILVALGLVFLAPFVLSGALLVGLGDTWFDLRERIRSAAG